MQVGFGRLVDCWLAVRLFARTAFSHEHRHLAQLSSPQFSPHFGSNGVEFLLIFIFPPLAGIQKGPFSPNFPIVLFPVGLCFYPSSLLQPTCSELVLLSLYIPFKKENCGTANSSPQPASWASKPLPTMGSPLPRPSSRSSPPSTPALWRSQRSQWELIPQSLGSLCGLW